MKRATGERSSERTLRSLRHKLTMAGSERCLESTQPDGTLLVVRVQSDEEHYAGRSAPPGVMHSDTEAFLRREPHRDDGHVEGDGRGAPSEGGVDGPR